MRWAPAPATKKAQLVALDVKAGDRVLFGKWSGTEVKIDGEDLLIMKESDILGVIEDRALPKAAKARRKPRKRPQYTPQLALK